MKNSQTLFPILVLALLFTQSIYAQENTLKRDSSKVSTGKLLPLQSDSAILKNMRISIPTIYPAVGKNGLQYNRFSDFSINSHLAPRINSVPIRLYGTGYDNINSKSRTAIASYSPVSRLNIYSAATLGLVETPFFGKGNYYILNAGANYLINSNLSVGLSGRYNSDFNVLPFGSISANLQYTPTRNLMLESSINYMKTGANRFNLNQSAILVDLHGRYRLADNWYMNAYGGFPVMQNNNRHNAPMMPMMNNTYYGGTAEYWFNENVGAEAGIIWIRDIISGKMEPQPKIELKFKPRR